MKSIDKIIIKIIILSAIIVGLVVIAHPISQSNQYVGIVAGCIIFILIGVIIANISRLLVLFFRKKSNP